MSRVVAVVQARMSSTRLPGKVLRTLGDRSVLAHVLARVGAAQRVDAVAVATSTGADDDALAEAAAALGAIVVRGSLTDVLDRYRLAAEQTGADAIVRVTADCPAFDPAVLDTMLAGWTSDDDYVSNFHPRTFPRGLDAEIVARPALERAAAEATTAWDREHVTPFLYDPARSGIRRRGVIRSGADLSDGRWTLDTAQDLAFFEALVAGFGERRYVEETGHAALAAYLAAHPAIVGLNADVEQRTVESSDPSAEH